MAMITLNSINLSINGETKTDILKELAKIAYSIGKVESLEGFHEDLLKREAEVSTGFGFGIAVPHAKSEYAKEVGIVIGRTTKEVEWDALDGKPVKTFICLISPKDGADEHLKLLAKISRKLMHEEFTDILKHGEEQSILKAINEIIMS